MMHTEKRWTPEEYMRLVQAGKVNPILPCRVCNALPMPDIVLDCPGTWWSTWHIECAHCGEDAPAYPPRGLQNGQQGRLKPNRLAGAIGNWNYMQEHPPKGD